MASNIIWNIVCIINSQSFSVIFNMNQISVGKTFRVSQPNYFNNIASKNVIIVIH